MLILLEEHCLIFEEKKKTLTPSCGHTWQTKSKETLFCFTSFILFYCFYNDTHTFADNIKVPYLGERPKQYTFKFEKI